VSLNFDVVGQVSGPTPVEWDTRDSLLYALGVGAGQEDPLAELDLTTENTEGHPQQTVPTFGAVLVQAHSPKPHLGDYHPGKQLHGEQLLTVHRPLPPSGAALLRSWVSGMYDKGSGAMVVIEGTLHDPDDGTVLLHSELRSFIVGEGGFGGPPAPASAPPVPEDPPDGKLTVDARPDQALLYRLCADRNRLHSDPAFAAAAGYDKPILHGLCTYGIACRLLVRELAAGDGSRLRRLTARFSNPVVPGQQLSIEYWEGDPVRFRVRDASGSVVLDRGEFESRGQAR
jgi:acyl dehydratase